MFFGGITLFFRSKSSIIGVYVYDPLSTSVLTISSYSSVLSLLKNHYYYCKCLNTKYFLNRNYQLIFIYGIYYRDHTYIFWLLYELIYIKSKLLIIQLKLYLSNLHIMQYLSHHEKNPPQYNGNLKIKLTVKNHKFRWKYER